MRMRSLAAILAALFFGAMFGALLAPQPATAVSREIIELQQSVNQLIQNQQDFRSTFDQKIAELRTLVGQSSDSVSKLSSSLTEVQKNVQETQANAGARIDTLATQTQGLSDNMQDLQARVGKVSQQLTDVQSLLQSIDAKIPAQPTSGGPGMNMPNPAAPSAISSDTLYQNGLRDYNSGKYDLARQEFADFMRNFPNSDLASNAQFYLGEINYSQHAYADAIAAYDKVLVNYPNSYKLAAAALKKGEATLAIGQKASAERQFREVVRRWPGTDESRRAQGHLKELAPRSAR